MKIPINNVSVAPTLEPVSASQVRDNAYIVDDSSYDTFIQDQLIPAARAYVEELAKRSLMTQTRIQYYDYLPNCMYLRYGPVQSVSSITYKDSNAASQTLSSALYTVDVAGIPARVCEAYNKTYPTAIHDTNSVVVTAVHGYGDSATDVPMIYRRAIIVLASFWLHNRAAFACGDTDEQVTRSLERMIAIEGATVEYA